MSHVPFTAGFADELTELYPDSVVSEKTPTAFEIDAPRGSFAGVHILLNGLNPGHHVKVAGQGKWYRLIDVPVEVNSGDNGWTEANDGKTNPNVIRRAPFRIYDALEPISADDFISENPTAGLRFELPISASTHPGTKTFKLKISQGQAFCDLTFKVHICKATVPPVGKESIKYTSWWSIENVAKSRNVEPWSEPFWDELARYAELMKRGRQNTILTPWASFVTKAGDTYELDRSKLKRFVDLFEKRGIYWLEGGHFAGRENGVWSAAHFTLNMSGKRINDPEGKRQFAQIAKELHQTIQSEGWQGRWFQHLADEPIDENADDYLKMAEQAKSYLPGIPIFDATMSTKLVGAVDAWCPKIHEYQGARTWFEQRKASKNQVWAYTCCDPGGNWLNRFLDMERIRPVYLGWAVVKFDLDGFLHWGFNYWEADPFKTSVVKPGDAWTLPAGDSHIAYPGKDGPISSTRLEAQRIGFEDGELLKKLKKKDPAAFERVSKPVFRAADDYSKDVAAYRTARRALFDELEKSK